MQLLFLKQLDLLPTMQHSLLENLSMSHLHNCTISRIEEIARINDYFKEERIILQIRLISLKNRMSNKQWTS